MDDDFTPSQPPQVSGADDTVPPPPQQDGLVSPLTGEAFVPMEEEEQQQQQPFEEGVYHQQEEGGGDPNSPFPVEYDPNNAVEYYDPNNSVAYDPNAVQYDPNTGEPIMLVPDDDDDDDNNHAVGAAAYNDYQQQQQEDGEQQPAMIYDDEQGYDEQHGAAALVEQNNNHPDGGTPYYDQDPFSYAPPEDPLQQLQGEQPPLEGGDDEILYNEVEEGAHGGDELFPPEGEENQENDLYNAAWGLVPEALVPADPYEHPEELYNEWANSADPYAEYRSDEGQPFIEYDEGDYDDDDGSDRSKDEPKGTVLPVWLFLTVAVLASVLGATAMAGPSVEQKKQGPPALLFDPNLMGNNNGPNALPTLPNVPDVPCLQDDTCGYIMGAIEPVFPQQNRALLNIPGTCQNWARDWLRTDAADVRTMEADRVRQRFAMALVYCEFNGDNWLSSDLWVSELHECDWYSMIGVDPCNRQEQYEIIRNYGQQMRGTLPPELSMMSSLWEIMLSDNLISGTIPTELENLSSLDTLSLSFNLFEGPIPDYMWQFEDMTYLDLAYNFLTGTLPETLHLTAPNMQVLFLENNDLKGSIPSTFGSLDWHRLHLDGNELTGPVPEDINAANLEELMLHNNKLTGAFPAESFANDFGGKSKLRELTIYENEIAGNVDEMCNLIYDGTLTLLEVDLDKVECQCCSGAP